MTKWIVLAALALGQDSAKIKSLVKELGSDDWVAQAKAAKELAQIGKPAMWELETAGKSDNTAVRYWAETISAEIRKREPSIPAPAAALPEPDASSFDETNTGSILFICNSTKHGDYEVVILRCLTCAKTKRFGWDFNAKVFRCGVCKTPVTSLRCDMCGESPGPKKKIRIKK